METPKQEKVKPMKTWKVLVGLVTLGMMAFFGFAIGGGVGLGLGIAIWFAFVAAIASKPKRQ